MSNRNLPKRISFTTAIPFDQPATVMPETTISGALTFTINETDAQETFGAMVRLIADGSHTPDFSDFALEGPGSWVNTSGTVNKCFFYFDGTQYCVIITQPGAGGTGGGGGGLTQLSTPGSFTATPVGSDEIDLSWSDVANDVGYKIYFNGVNDFGSSTLLTTTATNATSYHHTGLSPVSTFYYWIKAVGDGTTYSDSNTATTNATTGAASEDAYTTAWADASGISAGSYRSAVDTFIKALRTASILTTHFDFLHILCGGDAAKTKLNVIDPTDADASYRLTYNNSATFAATGVTGNGTNQTISTHFIPGLAAKMSVNDSHVAVYHRTSAGADNPVWGINQTGKQIYLFPKESGGAGAFRYTNQSNISFTPANAKGFWLARKNASNQSLYKDGTEINNALDNGNSEVLSPDYDIVFNGWNNNGTPALAHAGELSIISGGKYLNDTQRGAYESAVAALATALSL